MPKTPEEILEPRGWFRWLHDQFAGRYAQWGRFRGDIPSTEGENLDASSVAGRSWEIGFDGRLDVLDQFWSALMPLQRGTALAGVSENQNCWEWISLRLSDCELDAVATCELACNAVLYEQESLLSTVLDASRDLTGEVPRYDGPGRKSGGFSETLSQLSCRCVDLVLEAALIRKDTSAIRLALKHGANPDIQVWILERSFSEKHCALSYSIKNRMRPAVAALLGAGAKPGGIPFCTPNLSLFHAISTRQDSLAIKLLKMQATFADAGQETERKRTIAEIRRTKPRLISPADDYFFGHFEEDLDWAEKVIGSLIPFVPVEEKPCFYIGHGQGGYWRTFLDIIGGDVTRMKRFEAYGLDTRLSAEEFLSVFDGGHYDKLLYLLSREPDDIRARVLFRVRRRNPAFGEQGPMTLRPQDDRVSEVEGFDPGTQKPCRLADGSVLYVDLSAIAPPGHPHGTCLEGHFWLRVEESTMRRRGDSTIMKRLHLCWEMVKRPENMYQLKRLLPVVRVIDGRAIRIGCTLGNFAFHAKDERTAKRIRKWEESAPMDRIADMTGTLIEAQDAANSRPPVPVLSHEELDGYPKGFWPYLVRVDSGCIGMTKESSAGKASLVRRYRTWERKNKKEDSFVPDPRILDYDIWQQVPPELRPFLTWDDLFERPGFRTPDGSEYEKTMSRKATQWWNEMMIPKALAAIEQFSAAEDAEKERTP